MDEDELSMPNTRSTLGRTIIDRDAFAEVKELEEILDGWMDVADQPNHNHIPTLERIAEVLEKAHEAYLQLNPDPLDDRHPAATSPTAAYGEMLRAIVKRDDFLHALVNSYLLARDNMPLNEVSARVMLSCIPGLDPESVFSDPEDLISHLYAFALRSESEILRAYSMGLLASALEVQDNAGKHRSDSAALIPVALQRLKSMKEEMDHEREEREQSNSSDEVACSSTGSAKETEEGVVEVANDIPESAVRVRKRMTFTVEEEESPPRKKRRTLDPLRPLSPPRSASPCTSSSQWNVVRHTLIGSHKIHPLTKKMHQRLILQFLGTIGDYQDLVALAFEGGAMSLLFDYISIDYTDDIRLTFDALKYLCSLLVHRKFALEFVHKGGVEALLKVPMTSLAAVGVSTCFYYLSYGMDVMESICQLEDRVLDEVMDYMLWVAEHSHESGMSSSAMFLSYALPFRAMLDRFDAKDGLRKLNNYMSTLTILQEQALETDLTEDQVQTSMQSVRNACSAFLTYVRSHLFLRIEQLRRTLPSSTMKNALLSKLSAPSTTHPYPAYKPMHLDEDVVHHLTWILSSIQRTLSSPWKAMEDLRRLGIVKLLLSTIIKTEEWQTNPNSPSRAEIAINAANIISVAATTPRVQKELCEGVSEEIQRNGITILMTLCENNDAMVTLAGLRCIITSISTPLESERRRGTSEKGERRLPSPALELLERVWKAMRNGRGIMVLNSSLRRTKPVTEADEIRALTCKALVELARDPEVKNILMKMPLIAANQLQDLMREPVCPEKKAEHSRFCTEAKNLLAVVTEKSLKDVKRDLTHERLWNAHVVSSTKISYNDKELLQLIHSHLQAKGYHNAASALSAEADLACSSDSNATVIGAKHLSELPSRNIITRPRESIVARRSPLPSTGLKGLTPRGKSTEGKQAFTAVTPFPRRLQIKPTPGKARSNDWTQQRAPTMELNDIVTEYFRVQHSNCANPVSTCPPFSLFHPHRCPEPMQTRLYPNNIAMRWLHTPTYNQRAKPLLNRMNEQFIFSRLRSAKLFQEHEEMYYSCAFSIDDEHLIVGMYSGEVHWINVETSNTEATIPCHHSAVKSIVASKDGSMLLTSGLYMPPQSTLWRLSDGQEHIMDFPKEQTVLFNNGPVQDRIIGTKGSVATIYDLETGRALHSLENTNESKLYYTHAKASFSPCDNLVLNDSTLYDIRQPNPIVRTFDRLNLVTGGCFHPHGNEIIINTEVWDMRSFGLLCCVPAIDQCRLEFNSTGNVMVAAARLAIHDPYKTHYSNVIRTVSTKDYSVISTWDAKKPLLDFSISHNDGMIGVVEIQKQHCSREYMPRSDDTACRTYEIGKIRVADDDAEEGEGEDDGGAVIVDSDATSSSSDDEDDDETETDEDEEEEDEEEEDEDEVIDQVMNYLGRVAGVSDEEMSEGEEEGEEGEGNEEGEENGDSERSSGWETASNQDEEEENGEEEEEEEEEEGEEEGDGVDFYTDDERESGDEEYNADNDDRGGTGTIPLNPHLRRRRAQPR